MTVRRAERLTYAEVVSDFFLDLRGSGLMLSPADLELVDRWKAESIPVEVVCRGLKMGRESHARLRPGVRPPQNLSYYASAVEEAWRAFRERRVGRGERPSEEW